MSYTPIDNLVSLIDSFRSSFPKTISMFWMIKKLYPVDIRPVNGTGYYDETVREISASLRAICPKMRIGVKKMIITRDIFDTLTRTNLINDNTLLQL